MEKKKGKQYLSLSLLRSRYYGRHATIPHSSSAFLSLKLTNKEQASIFWSLSAKVTSNMIGAAVNNYMHVIGSQ